MKVKELKNLSDRLRYALETLNVSQSELASRISVKRQNINYLCSAGIERSKFSHDIAEALKINVDWLITGEGEMIETPSVEKSLLANQVAIPILSWDQVKSWVNGELSKDSIKNWTTTHTRLNNLSFALQLKDNSMYPRFDSETIVIIDTNKQPKPPCFVLVYINQLHELVFRQLTNKEEKLTLEAYNEAGYKELPLTNKDNIIGCMVEAKWIAS